MGSHSRSCHSCINKKGRTKNSDNVQTGALFATISHSTQRPAITESLNAVLARINEWCSMWNMKRKLNPSKTKTMIAGRSRTVVPVHREHCLGNCVLNESTSIVILGVTFDSKMFVDHIRNVASSAGRAPGIMRRANTILGNVDVVRACFRSYLLSRLEYCAPVWILAASEHLRLLDTVVRREEALCGNGKG